jgi:hypothetical protein
MGKRLTQYRASCLGGMVIVSECLSWSLDSTWTINLNGYYYDQGNSYKDTTGYMMEMNKPADVMTRKLHFPKLIKEAVSK